MGLVLRYIHVEVSNDLRIKYDAIKIEFDFLTLLEISYVHRFHIHRLQRLVALNVTWHQSETKKNSNNALAQEILHFSVPPTYDLSEPQKTSDESERAKYTYHTDCN